MMVNPDFVHPDNKRDEAVWVLVIEHRHGFNHYVNRTKEGMLEELTNYCVEWWDEYGDPYEMPLTQQEIIDNYFDDHDSEFYTYDLVAVKD